MFRPFSLHSWFKGQLWVFRETPTYLFFLCKAYPVWKRGTPCRFLIKKNYPHPFAYMGGFPLCLHGEQIRPVMSLVVKDDATVATWVNREVCVLSSARSHFLFFQRVVKCWRDKEKKVKGKDLVNIMCQQNASVWKGVVHCGGKHWGA